MDEVRLDISEMREQMDVLRQKLKSKFGDAVHLEDESEEEGVDEVNH